jgi:glucose dehydrogenase
VRPGTNLFTDSVIALDPDTGTQRWDYQFTLYNVWDYDGVNENILFDLNGRKLLAHFDKNGYLFILDRRNGELARVTKFAPATGVTLTRITEGYGAAQTHPAWNRDLSRSRRCICVPTVPGVPK